jgi:hypothetical protein
VKVAIVGATGNIGFPLAKKLLAAGHQVRALSRGGAKLDELVKLGAEPFIGSFDRGTEGVEEFFQGADAAFTMVKSDWTNWHHHYPAVAKRIATALRQAPTVKLIVNLSAFGGDVNGDTGHSYCFYELEQALNQLTDRRIVHVRGGWFMENFFEYYDSIARYGKMPAYFSPDLKLPLVAARHSSRCAGGVSEPTHREPDDPRNRLGRDDHAAGCRHYRARDRQGGRVHADLPHEPGRSRGVHRGQFRTGGTVRSQGEIVGRIRRRHLPVPYQ